MNKTSKAIISAAILSVSSITAQACTGVIAGSNATVDGSVIIARNEDFGTNNWNKYLVHRNAQDNTPSDWTLGNGLIVPKPSHFYAYSAIPDWDAKTVNAAGKNYEERGINEYNVAISATTSAEINENAKKVDPLVEKGIVESNIPTLILPQVKTAKEGVKLLGKYIEEYGAGEGNSLYIADVNEAWLFEIGSGHQWIAVRVPDDSYSIVANGLRVHGIDLNDANILHSAGLYNFVEENNLLKGGDLDLKSFNFAKAFGVIADTYNTDREWLGQKMLTGSVAQDVRQDQYPLFMKPDNKISVQDIAKVLSATYVGTELQDIAKRPMRVDRQLESHVIQLRKDMPKELQGIIWQSFGVLADSVLIPIYTSLEEYPAAYGLGTDVYSDDSAYWQFRSLTALASSSEKYTGIFQEAWKNESVKIAQEVSKFDKELIKLYKTDKAAAIKMASDYSDEKLVSMLKMATELRFKIMTDLTKSTEKKYSEEEFKKIMSL